MSNSYTYSLTDAESSILQKVIDKCRVKTRLNKESMIDELQYASEEDDGQVQLYPLEWNYIITAVEDKLSKSRIQDRDVLEDLLHELKKLRKTYEQ